jgi:hypothetical protein
MLEKSGLRLMGQKTLTQAKKFPGKKLNAPAYQHAKNAHKKKSNDY